MSRIEEAQAAGAGGAGIAAEASARWSVARVAGYAVLTAMVFYVTQIVVAVAIAVGKTAITPGFDFEAWAQTAETDGFLLAIGTIVSAAVTVPFVNFLVRRREPEPWRFLGFEPTTTATIGKWLALLAALIVASDALTLALGRPIVPEFMTAVYATVNPALLLVALVFAAPLCEEVFFRGFAMSALQSAGVPLIAVAVITSAAWALMHLQYDFYGIGTIFVMGLLLAAARVKSGSILPCIAMHALANVIATAQVAYLA